MASRQERLQALIDELDQGCCRDCNPYWTFSDKNNMQEILPDLFLGPWASACLGQLPNLQAEGITHIVCVRRSPYQRYFMPCFEGHIIYHTVTVEQHEPSILEHVGPTNQFVHTAISQGGRVLIHGTIDDSDSGALAIAYAMLSEGWNFETALKHVTSRRQCLLVEEKFQQELKSLEPSSQPKDQIRSHSEEPDPKRRRF